MPRTSRTTTNECSRSGHRGVIAPNVLEASERRSSGESNHDNAAQGDHDAGKLGLHAKGSFTSPFEYCPETRSSSFAAFAIRRPRKPTRLIGRSVALLARLHPKCPFQAELLRVRASLPCLLVLRYWGVPGL
jgi:hypothetical protein